MTLHLDHLTCFRHGKFLLQNVHLTFQAGNIWGILGPNGSGKSTLMKLITGIWAPYSGEVLWQGQNLHEKPRHAISRIVTLVPQSIQINFEYSVLEMVSMGRYSHSIHEHDQKLIQMSLEAVDAWHLRHYPITQLSSGERQLVYIARALATEAPVLLLDEPTANLDLKHHLIIWKLLEKLRKQGKIIIITNHDLNTTRRFCDHIAILNHGKCVCSGDFNHMIDSNRLLEVFGVMESDTISETAYTLP